MLSALSAYLLKSLRQDNGRAAKITLLGPGRAGFLSPYPRLHPILLQPRPCWAPPRTSPGRLLPACTCAWGAPHPPPRPGDPSERCPRPRRRGQSGHHSTSHKGNGRAGSARVLGTLRGREFVSAAHLHTVPWDARKLKLRCSVACASERPSVDLFLPPASF